MRQHELDDIAHRALARYALPDHRLLFLRHGDTATYKVEASDGDAWLLRVHVPVTLAMGGHGADVDAVNSELLWLEALGRETSLPLQTPVRNLDGDPVTPVSIPEGAAEVNCTLLGWLVGGPYHRDLETERTAHHIGRILATLHDHASRWEPPEGFTRPRRDEAYFERALAAIRPARDDGRIEPGDHAELEASIERLVRLLRSRKEDRRTDGLMHADAHKGNLLHEDGRIHLIDFSFCAFGCFMFDLGVAMSDMKPSLHPAFLGGYRGVRPLPEGHAELVEGLCVGSLVGTLSYWAGNPRARELLVRKAPELTRMFAVPFNRGVRFWFA